MRVDNPNDVAVLIQYFAWVTVSPIQKGLGYAEFGKATEGVVDWFGYGAGVGDVLRHGRYHKG